MGKYVFLNDYCVVFVFEAASTHTEVKLVANTTGYLQCWKYGGQANPKYVGRKKGWCVMTNERHALKFDCKKDKGQLYLRVSDGDDWEVSFYICRLVDLE